MTSGTAQYSSPFTKNSFFYRQVVASFGSRDTLLWPLPLWSETEFMNRPLKQQKWLLVEVQL